MPSIPASVATRSVTIGRLPFGFSAAPASGSSAGSSTRWVRVPVIFMASPQEGGVGRGKEKNSAEKLHGEKDAGKDDQHAAEPDRDALFDFAKSGRHVISKGDN